MVCLGDGVGGPQVWCMEGKAQCRSPALVPGGLSGGGCLPRKEGRQDTIWHLLGTGQPHGRSPSAVAGWWREEEGDGAKAEFFWRARAVTCQITQIWRSLGSLPGPSRMPLLHLSALGFSFLQSTFGANGFRSDLELFLFLSVYGENSSHIACCCLSAPSVRPS